MASYRPSLRALAAVGILTAWGGSLTWLGLRRLEGGEEAEMALLASRRLAPGEARFAIYIGSVQIGSAGITLDTLSPGYRIIETTTLETRGDTGLSRALRMTETDLAPDLTLVQVKNRFVKLGMREEGQARFETGRLTLRMQGGATGAVGFPEGESPIPLVAVPFQMAVRGYLRPGYGWGGVASGSWPTGATRTTWHVSRDSTAVFPDSAELDPGTLRWKPVHWDTAKVFIVEARGPGGPFRLLIERNGTVAGIDYPLGTRWHRTDFNMAVSDFRRILVRNTDSILAALPAIEPYSVSAVRRDTGTAERTFLLARRSGARVESGVVSALGTGRQIVLGDTVRVRATSFRSGITGSSDAAYDPYIQRDAAPIGEFIRSIEPGGTGVEQIQRLVSAVHARVALDTSYAAPVDAIGTARARRGRPDGIARLFVALAREWGMPARYMVGFAPTVDGVATHAWAEVWLPDHDGWIAVDPVLGRASASTNLIRLGFAGSSHPLDLLIALADARVTAIDSTRTP